MFTYLLCLSQASLYGSGEVRKRKMSKKILPRTWKRPNTCTQHRGSGSSKKWFVSFCVDMEILCDLLTLSRAMGWWSPCCMSLVLSGSISGKGKPLNMIWLSLKFKNGYIRGFLAVHWLRLCASSMRARTGSILVRELRFLCLLCGVAKIKKYTSSSSLNFRIPIK